MDCLGVLSVFSACLFPAQAPPDQEHNHAGRRVEEITENIYAGIIRPRRKKPCFRKRSRVIKQGRAPAPEKPARDQADGPPASAWPRYSCILVNTLNMLMILPTAMHFLRRSERAASEKAAAI